MRYILLYATIIIGVFCSKLYSKEENHTMRLCDGIAIINDTINITISDLTSEELEKAIYRTFQSLPNKSWNIEYCDNVISSELVNSINLTSIGNRMMYVSRDSSFHWKSPGISIGFTPRVTEEWTSYYIRNLINKTENKYCVERVRTTKKAVSNDWICGNSKEYVKSCYSHFFMKKHEMTEEEKQEKIKTDSVFRKNKAFLLLASITNDHEDSFYDSVWVKCVESHQNKRPPRLTPLYDFNLMCFAQNEKIIYLEENFDKSMILFDSLTHIANPYKERWRNSGNWKYCHYQ